MQLAARSVLDADGAPALKQDPVRQTVRKYPEIDPPSSRPQVPDGCAASPAATLRDLIEPRARFRLKRGGGRCIDRLMEVIQVEPKAKPAAK